MTAKYLVPPEHYSFARDSKYLFFDPVNFIWFVTDGKGKAVVDEIARTQSSEAAAEALVRLLGYEIHSSAVAEYVDKYVGYLLRIGFLHEDEYKRARLPSGIADRQQVLYLHLTSKCNLHCPYCYNQEHRIELIQIGKIADSSSISTEGRTEDFLKVINEAAQLGFLEIKLTGGEATLNKDFLLMARLAKSQGMRVNLLTNGTLITPNLARDIAEVVDSVSLSIDSANPEKHDAVRGRGTHAKVVQAFRLLKEAGIKCMHVNAVITPANIDSVGDFLDYAFNDLKADRVTTAGSDIQVDDPENRWGAAAYQLGEDQQYRLYEQTHEFYSTRGAAFFSPTSRSRLFRRQCGAANGIVSIDANGDVYPCQTLHRPEFRCGNAFKSGLGRVLVESAVLRNVRGSVVDILPECQICAVRYICAGGCRAEAYSRQGNFLAWNRTMCKTLFATAINQLWNSATTPVQDSEKAFPSTAQQPHCMD